MRYKFYVTDNKVICVSSYAGKAVRGVAKCDPKDTFNLEDGKKLAQARCDYKIAKRRVLRARAKHAEAIKALEDARAYEDKMRRYSADSFIDFLRLDEELTALEAKM